MPAKGGPLVLPVALNEQESLLERLGKGDELELGGG
jgi:hypothetical protein